MIQNERQYEITRKKLQDLRQALEQARTQPASGLPEAIAQAGRGSIEMLIEDLQAEMAEYERLSAGQTRTLPLPSVLDDLPGVLVRARVARGWSHRDLAQALGTTEQQVQKDESGGYERASLRRLHRVAEALEITISGQAKLQPVRKQRRKERPWVSS